MISPVPQAMRTISLTSFFLISLILISYIHPLQIAYSQEPAQEEGKPTPLKRGIDLLNEKRFDDALEAFREASTLNPKDPQPYYFTALAYQAKKDLPQALAAIKKAVELAPEVPVVHLRMGIILEQMGRPGEAIEAYRQALKTPEVERGEETPQIREARERFKRLSIGEHFRTAKNLYREKRYEEALRELKDLLTLNPNDYPAYYLMGIVLREMERPKEAIEALKKVVEINPGYAEAYAQLGFIYERVSAFKEAEESLLKFLSLVPQSPMAEEVEKGIERVREGARLQKTFEAVGRLIKEERWDEALKENQVLEEIQPDHPHLFSNYGIIYSNLQRYEEAIANLKKALEKEPKLFLAHKHLAITYDKMGKFPEAVTEYDLAHASTTDEEERKGIDARLSILRAIVEVPERAEKVKELLDKGDIEAAIQEAERLIAGRKKDPKVYLILGGVYMQAGHFKEAEKTLKEAIQLDPKNQDIQMLLSEVYERLGREAEAIATYKSVAALAKDTPTGKAAMEKANLLETRLHFNKAKELKEGGDIEGALKEIMLILTISPENPIALFNAGVLNDLLDRPQEGESFLRKAIEFVPDYVEAYLQLGLLLEREGNFPGAEEAYRNVIRLRKEGDAYNLAKERLEGLREVVEITERIKSARTLLDKKDFEGALREAQASIALYPNNYLAYFYMGIIYDQTDKPDEAISALQSSIEIRPNFLQAYLLLGKVFILQEKLDEARETYKRIISIGKGTREGDMAAIQLRRLRPWRGSFSFSHSYNTNISYGVKAQPNYTSGYGLNWVYEAWRAKKGRVNAGISGSENIYYNNQLAGYGYTLFIKGDYRYLRDNTSSLNLSQRKGYFEGKLTSDEYTLNIDSDYKYSNDKVFLLNLSQSWGQRPVSRGSALSLNMSLTPRTIPTSLSLGYRFSKNRTFPANASDADRHTLSVNMGQNLGLKNSVTSGYSFSVNRNNNPLGNNYGNRSHTVSLGYNRILPFQMRGGLSYSIGFVQYMNPDSTSLFNRFRENIDHNIGGRLSFPLSEKVSFSLNYTYTKNRTSLPRPSAELMQTMEEFLSEPIPLVSGGYERHAATMSIGVSF